MDGELQGRCWRFGDNINTDLIWPSDAFRVSPEERLRMVFLSTRPGWAEKVQPGDVIVAGANFGTGSGRPAASLLAELGVAMIVAQSINGLFMRNSINSGLPVMECDVPELEAPEGCQISINLLLGTVTTESGVVFTGAPMPTELWGIVKAGGVLPQLRRNGYVAPEFTESIRRMTGSGNGLM